MVNEVIICELKIAETEICSSEIYSNMINIVFDEFVGKDYSEEGKKSFKDYLEKNSVFERLKNNYYKAYLARFNNEIIGILEIKNNNHISLFFVKKEHHKKGIGKKLFEYFINKIKQENIGINKITVNSSIYAEKIYSRLGFVRINDIQEKNGIIFIPMEYMPIMKTTKKNWHVLDTDEVVKQLNTDTAKGLSNSEAAERLQKYGKNSLPERKKESLIFKFLKQFNDIFIYILLGAAVITFFTKDYIETIVILGVAIINAFIGFIQENKAEAALEGIRKMLSLKAHVIRNGERIEIEAENLTIGDIVILSPGNKVPADLRLIRADNLHIEESALTGESVASEKDTETLPEDTVLGDRLNMAFSGTSVSTGTGIGIVVATGVETEIGKINQMMSDVETLKTPLLKQTALFAKWLSVIILSGSVLIFLFGYFFRDYTNIELLLVVIGLAIAAVPEGLPAILSIILAIGVQNMAKRKSIVRTLPSVETLGSVSVICSDKTGTLTKNEMTVKTLKTKGGEYQITGTGYAPEGDILLNNEKVDFAKEPVLRELIESFDICNEASIGKDADGHWIVNGAPTEGSLVTVVQKANLDLPHIERISTIPFDSAYKYMATLVEKDKYNVIYIKGAPDRLMQMAQFEKTAAGEKPLEKEHWEKEITAIAIRGQRLIGAAYKIVPKNITTITHDDIQNGVVFLGLGI